MAEKLDDYFSNTKLAVQQRCNYHAKDWSPNVTRNWWALVFGEKISPHNRYTACLPFLCVVNSQRERERERARFAIPRTLPLAGLAVFSIPSEFQVCNNLILRLSFIPGPAE